MIPKIIRETEPHIKQRFHFAAAAFVRIRGWSEQRILDEIQECVLLCACCHAAVHSGELQLHPDIA